MDHAIAQAAWSRCLALTPNTERRIDRCIEDDPWSPRAFSPVNVKALEWLVSENDLGPDHAAMIDSSAAATSVVVRSLLRSQTALKQLLACVHAVGTFGPQLWDGPIREAFESIINTLTGLSEDDLVLEQVRLPAHKLMRGYSRDLLPAPMVDGVLVDSPPSGLLSSVGVSATVRTMPLLQEFSQWKGCYTSITSKSASWLPNALAHQSRRWQPH